MTRLGRAEEARSFGSMVAVFLQVEAYQQGVQLRRDVYED